jgi:hypothetical protein
MQDFLGWLSVDLAQAIVEGCERQHLATMDGAVDLLVTGEVVEEELEAALAEFPTLLEEFHNSKENVIHTILMSRYKNLYPLLRDNVSEEMYLDIVRNQVLVDVQVSAVTRSNVPNCLSRTLSDLCSLRL